MKSPLEAMTAAVAPRPGDAHDGSFVVGDLRVRPRARPLPALPDDERERREHIRRWARMMIVHLERSDFDAQPEGYVPTLRRLRELLDREMARVEEADAA